MSFKHVQHVHMMDPVWNQSLKSQIEGRAIRFCSHVDIDPIVNAPLKRSVVLHQYKITNTPKIKNFGPSCDSYIYDGIILKKYGITR